MAVTLLSVVGILQILNKIIICRTASWENTLTGWNMWSFLIVQAPLVVDMVRACVDRLCPLQIGFAPPNESLGMQNALEADQMVVNCR